VKKIVDAGYLRDPALTDYLRGDIKNFVVLAECVCMESYKGNSITNITNSIGIISQFPNQIIVLKGTREIVSLSLLPDGFNNFEDPSQTTGFQQFCLGVSEANNGNLDLQRQILKIGLVASEHFNKTLREAEFFSNGIEILKKSLEPSLLKTLRKKEKITPEHRARIVQGILRLAGSLFQGHPDLTQIPQALHLPNSYILRLAISTYLLALRWISSSGYENAQKQKLRNDCTDMHYVAYATFYDGLLTNDTKMKEIYKETSFLLKNVFLSRPELSSTVPQK